MARCSDFVIGSLYSILILYPSSIPISFTIASKMTQWHALYSTRIQLCIKDALMYFNVLKQTEK